MIDRDLIGREQVYLINDSFQNRKQYNIPKATTKLLKQIANNELDEQLLKIAVAEYKNRIIVETGI